MGESIRDFRRHAVAVGLLVVILGTAPLSSAAGTAPARGGVTGNTTGTTSLAEVERVLFGGSFTGDRQHLVGAQIGGTDIGGAEGPRTESGSSDTGEKIKAGILSAIVPGTGQLYNRQNTKGYIMLGVEVAIWGTYFVFDNQGDNRTETYREYAGIYAGTQGEHEDGYWQAVGRYMDSDAYNEALLREARALGEAPPPLIGGGNVWQWRNESFLRNYQDLRADANNAYDRRDFVILFAVINRAISVFDAVRNAGARHPENPGLGAEVMGWNVALEVDNSWRDPGSRCVVSRRF